MKLRLLFLSLCLSIFGGLFLFNTTQAGFGASPAKIVNEHLTPGAHFEQTIYLVQSKPENDLKTTVVIESPVKDWITIDRGTEFTTPAGIQQFPIKVSIDVPSIAEFKKYGGYMDIESKKNGKGEGGGGNVTMSMGVRVGLALEVTRESFSEFVLRGVKVPDIEEKWPIKIFITIENLGNTKTGPSKVSLEILDQNKNLFKDLGEAAVSDGIKPFGNGDIVVEFPNELPLGEYWAKFKIFDGEKVLAENMQLFNVMPKGSLNKESAVGAFFAGFAGIFGLPDWAGLIIIVGIGAGLFILRRKGILNKKRFGLWKKNRLSRQRRRIEEKLRRLK